MSDYEVSLSEWASDRLLETSNNTERAADLLADLVDAEPDLATRVAADIFVRFCADRDDGVLRDLGVFREAAIQATVYGRIFAEAVAKEGK